MIEVQNVTLQIKGKMILSDVDLTMEEGRIYGLVGNNGSGKTMLMKCICGFVLPPSYYSGLKNLKLLAGLTGKKDTAHLRSVMELCGLDPGLRLPVRKYSLGMRQRLGIAQAIMEDQNCLILDEPMNGLDKRGVEDVRKLLLQLKEQGKLILIASHNKADIDILCDEVYEMESGVLHKIYG